MKNSIKNQPVHMEKNVNLSSKKEKEKGMKDYVHVIKKKNERIPS